MDHHKKLKKQDFSIYKYQTVQQEPLQRKEKGLFLHSNECTGSQLARTLEWNSLKIIRMKFSINTQEIQASFLFFFLVTDLNNWGKSEQFKAWGGKLQNIIPWDRRNIIPFSESFCKGFHKETLLKYHVKVFCIKT